MLSGKTFKTLNKFNKIWLKILNTHISEVKRLN